MLFRSYLLNHLEHPDLNWRTPIEACFGYTPDLSSLLLYTFFQRVYYLDSEILFPNSKEKAGRFVGITANVGDAMTFWILTEDTEQLIARSFIRDAEDPTTANKRLLPPDPGKTDEEKKSVVGILDVVPNTTLPVVDPDQLIGYSFATEHAGETQRVEVKGKQDDKYHVDKMLMGMKIT